ncbi:hypothetical protein ccbrp13_66550 [Ktedonobacteria bacterium brp13]|nr:hypothetical protein ccbrp13_66550 [Ktedonobacteria bacterium brp13]
MKQLKRFISYVILTFNYLCTLFMTVSAYRYLFIVAVIVVALVLKQNTHLSLMSSVLTNPDPWG